MASPLRVILVQPKTGILSEVKTHHSFPLSLLSAARGLIDEWEVLLIDQRIEDAWPRRLREALSEATLCVGITSITGPQLRHALEAGRLVKDVRPEIPLVWGGVHVTLLPENSLMEQSVDIVVRGEGEKTFPDLVRSLAHKKDLKDVPAICFRKGGTPVQTAQRDFVKLDELPPIPYHLAGADYCFLRRGKPSMYLETSRGCPFHCAFCYNSSIKNRHWRSMSPHRVIESIEEILTSFPKVGHLSIVDDNFFVDLDRIREICRLMINKGFGLTYQVQGTNIGTVLRLSAEDVALLRASGCERLDMGVESGSRKVLQDIDKGISTEDVVEANRKLKSFDIEPWFNFMGGFPGETADDLDSTLELMSVILRENRHALVSPLYCFTPYPGNKLFEESLRRGFKPPGSIEEWADYGWDRIRLPWITPRMAKKLESLYFLSIFIDRKVFEYASHWLLVCLALCYRPIARLRFRYRILGFMIEAAIYRRLFERRKPQGTSKIET